MMKIQEYQLPILALFRVIHNVLSYAFLVLMPYLFLVFSIENEDQYGLIMNFFQLHFALLIH